MYDVSKVGGGIFQSGGSLNICGGYIAGNSADLGGGVYLDNSGFSLRTTSDSFGVIAYNQATDGGGVYSYTTGFFELLAGVSISNNLATRGGGIFIESGADLAMGSIYGKIQNNCATVAKTGVVNVGGGIYVQNANLSIYDGATINNNSASDGGGVYVASGGDLVMSGGYVRENKAENGGGVYVDHGDFNMSGGSIYLNDVKVDGGGVYIECGSFRMSDGDIYGNKAKGHGGGIYSYEASTFTISGGAEIGKLYIQKSSSSNEWGNTAEYGGGVFLRSGTLTMSGGKIQYNCATKNGGGLLVEIGRAHV